MPYQLNPVVAHQDSLRSRSIERAHVAALAARRELLMVRNLAVDVPNLIRRPFACDTRQCVRREDRHGRPWYRGSCCTDPFVEVTPPELFRLETLARNYRRRFPRGPRGIGQVARKIVGGEILTASDQQETILAHGPDNRCILSFLGRAGTLRCAVHAMAERLADQVVHFKLDTCRAFPLHYVDYDEGRWFLTVVCARNHRMLGADRALVRLPCLTRPPAGAPPAYVALRGELEHLWGARFWAELDRRAQRLLQSPQ